MAGPSARLWDEGPEMRFATVTPHPWIIRPWERADTGHEPLRWAEELLLQAKRGDFSTDLALMAYCPLLSFRTSSGIHPHELWVSLQISRSFRNTRTASTPSGFVDVRTVSRRGRRSLWRHFRTNYTLDNDTLHSAYKGQTWIPALRV